MARLDRMREGVGESWEISWEIVWLWSLFLNNHQFAAVTYYCFFSEAHLNLQCYGLHLVISLARSCDALQCECQCLFGVGETGSVCFRGFF